MDSSNENRDESSFGHAVLSQFCLDPSYINLNVGSFGCLPHAVRIAYDQLSLELEAMPDLFIRRKMASQVTQVRTLLATHTGATVDNCVMIPSVAHGINTILRNFPWNENDKLIIASTTFHTISRAVDCLSFTDPHPTVSTFECLFPTSHTEILNNFRKCVQSTKAADSSASVETRGQYHTVVLFDSIISMPGVCMPWKEMVRICKDEGVWSIVDAAHSLGQELNIELDDTDPDFWVANCNKWLSSKRGSALLYVPLRNQDIIKYSFPPGIGAASPSNTGVSAFVGEFHWNGSKDIITALTVKAALEFRSSHGGEERIINYCHNLAMSGGKYLADMLGTEVMLSPSGNPDELVGNMVNVAIPLPPALKPSADLMRRIDKTLLEEKKVYAAVFYHNRRWWTRVSVHIFNEVLSLWGLDVFHQFIVGAFVYHYLITAPGSRLLDWTFVANLVLELLLSNIIQIFYAVRLWKLTPKPKLVFLAVVPLIINNLFLGIYVPVNLSNQVADVSKIADINFKWAVITLLAGTSALDFILSTSLIHALIRMGSQMRWATSSLQVVAAFVANTGFLAR
ncbi:hypothetical protein D9757_009920 [Collybiopsis confluens]|uniref:Aminotransferase class V domain-containing protein n=1 Tax=Collybiopsis confluens TaxID=2823264 RepID=A0A8H5GWB3_9AGAR|nr:hypothetical protein D9757_009920 [Collybiopsis confluens]